MHYSDRSWLGGDRGRRRVEGDAMLGEHDVSFRIDRKSEANVALEARLEMFDVLSGSAELSMQQAPGYSDRLIKTVKTISEPQVEIKRHTSVC